jgi:hypothetical protein
MTPDQAKLFERLLAELGEEGLESMLRSLSVPRREARRVPVDPRPAAPSRRPQIVSCEIEWV